MNREIKNNPVILVILDGWGLAAPSKGNPISLAKTPTMDGILRKYPATKLYAHGEHVGLPDSEVGNSEAGHTNIGAGRVVEQDAVRINRAIENGTFYKNAAFLEVIRNVNNKKTKLHIMGMLSDEQSPHSDMKHLIALMQLCRNSGVEKIYLHLFTDGRDSSKYASLRLVEELEENCPCPPCIVTVMGRFFAMDRKKKWQRTEKAYNALVLGQGRKSENVKEAIQDAYGRGESDEYIEPCIIGKGNTRIDDGDGVIFFNLRSDRARQLTKVFVQKNFNKMNPGSFKRRKVFNDLHFITMTDFGPDLDSILTAFPSVDLNCTLPMQLIDLKQLYIAETEKYAHVTYFFNGGYSGTVAGEDQLMVPSPDVESYDRTIAMSSDQLTQVVLDNIKIDKIYGSSWKYDFITLNFAAPDMIGHTGNLEAGIKCCERVDRLLGKIIGAYLKINGTVVITADHGNVEEMINLDTGEILTEHTTNQVPFIIANKKIKNKIKLRSEGSLSDIAPTVLELLGRQKPREMRGRSLIINL